jgi:hypothetical protein
MAMFACENCGGVEDIAPSRIRCGRRYCSVKCKAEAVRTRPTPGKVEMACIQCGQTFLCPRSWAREGRRKFCGRTCRNRHLATIHGPAHPKFGIPRSAETRDKIVRTKAVRGTASRRENHPGWKGGRWVRDYVQVMIDVLPDDQRAMARLMRPNQGYISEHRLVMAMTLGRPLQPREVVHHKNGVKTDNRPENLTLMDWGHHSRKHRHIERKLASLLAEVETLRAENARLKSLLATYPPGGSDTSS